MTSATPRVTDAHTPPDRRSETQSGDWQADAVVAAHGNGARPIPRETNNTAAPYVNAGFHLSGDTHTYPTQQTITVDGGNHHGTATLMLPDNYDPHKKYPLIVALHGYNGNVNDISNMMDLQRLRKEGNIVLVPAAQNHSWNGSGVDYFGDAKGTNGQPINDVDFVKSAINQVESKFNVNRNDITLSAFSQGGQLAYELAANMDNNPAQVGRVRTLISAAGSDPEGRAGQTIDALRGTNIVQYEPGHNGMQNIGNFLTGDPTVADFLPRLVAAKGGKPNPGGDSNRNGVQITSYKGSDGSTVTEISEPNGEHAWPGQPQANDSSLLGRGSISHVDLTDWVSDYSNAFRNR